MEAVTVFISLGSKITADHNCSQSLHEKMLAPWKESNDKPRQHIKKQRLPTEVCIDKAMVFPVVVVVV